MLGRSNKGGSARKYEKEPSKNIKMPGACTRAHASRAHTRTHAARSLCAAAAAASRKRKKHSGVKKNWLIARVAPARPGDIHPATKSFQALRIAVNDEIGSLKRGLEGAVKILKPGGRLAVLTFHSKEDSQTKRWMRDRARNYEFDGEVDVPALRRARTPEMNLVTRKAIMPGEAELADNPRSRSAQLRVAEKI